MNSRFDRSERAIKNASDLLVGKINEVLEHDRRPEGRGNLRQGPPEDPGSLNRSRLTRLRHQRRRVWSMAVRQAIRKTQELNRDSKRNPGRPA